MIYLGLSSNIIFESPYLEGVLNYSSQESNSIIKNSLLVMGIFGILITVFLFEYIQFRKILYIPLSLINIFLGIIFTQITHFIISGRKFICDTPYIKLANKESIIKTIDYIKAKFNNNYVEETAQKILQEKFNIPLESGIATKVVEASKNSNKTIEQLSLEIGALEYKTKQLELAEKQALYLEKLKVLESKKTPLGLGQFLIDYWPHILVCTCSIVIMVGVGVYIYKTDVIKSFVNFTDKSTARSDIVNGSLAHIRNNNQAQNSLHTTVTDSVSTSVVKINEISTSHNNVQNFVDESVQDLSLLDTSVLSIEEGLTKTVTLQQSEINLLTTATTNNTAVINTLKTSVDALNHTGYTVTSEQLKNIVFDYNALTEYCNILSDKVDLLEEKIKLLEPLLQPTNAATTGLRC